MFAAAAMSLSSFCVVTNALRLNFVKIRKNNIQTETVKTIEKENVQMEKTIKIEGMMCPHCEATVKKPLEELDGVTQAVASHKNGTAVVTLEKDVPFETLKKAVEDKGYTVNG